MSQPHKSLIYKPLPQVDPPLSPRETLPTMYDLPSEDPEEPGLPDEYHDLQPNFLSRTFRSVHYSPQQIFTGTDLNLYYDVRHPLWHKRPDWFLAVGVPRLYDGVDLRSSYVVWQEGVNPFIVVELLSPGTEKEDLGEAIATNRQTAAVQEDTQENTQEDTQEDTQESKAEQAKEKETPPGKWEVYEQILRIPYYVVFSRYTNQVRFFHLVGGSYQEQPLDAENPRIWIAELELGLGLWFGEFEGIERLWLRWYDSQGNWMPTDTELERQRAQLESQRAEAESQRAEAESQRAETESQRADQLRSQLQQVVLNLLATGMSIEQVATLTGLSAIEVEQFTH